MLCIIAIASSLTMIISMLAMPLQDKNDIPSRETLFVFILIITREWMLAHDCVKYRYIHAFVL